MLSQSMPLKCMANKITTAQYVAHPSSLNRT